MADRIQTLTWPAAGIDRSLGFQQQPPYTCYDAQNVRLFESYERRSRGGSRGGLKLAVAKHVDMLGPVRYLGTVGWVDGGTRKECLVAIAGVQGRDLFYTNTGTTFTKVANAVQQGTTQLFAGQKQQKLYIADPAATGFAQVRVFDPSNGTVASVSESTYSTGTVTIAPDAGGSIVTLASGTWPTLTGRTSELTVSTNLYTVKSRTSDTQIVLDNVNVTAGPGAAYSLAIVKGDVPDDCPLCCTYRDRLVLAGPNHVWYMSRLCSPGDWDYASDVDDPARAVAGSNSDAALIGELITALIPHGDQDLLFGYYNSLWLLQGDPAYGGSARNLSREIGILTGSSWCRTPEGVLVFLSVDGLYGLQQGTEAFPEALSREKLPDSLLGLDASDYITLGYDIEEGGIHINRTPTAGTGEHWFFDWQSKSFWKDVLPAESQPTYSCNYSMSLSTIRKLLLGTRGGYVLKFDDDYVGDVDSTGGPDDLISSYVLIGPIFPGGANYNRGVLKELYGMLDESSANVVWELMVADTAELALGATAFTTGTWTAGRNASEHPRAGGAAIVIKLSATGRWALESVVTRISHAGRELVS